MADFVRRLVSGDKARFKDKELDLELDLVYVTDQVIIMGFPASGVEGYYRNKREDAKKFLEHRHGKNYWVYNFCPVKENSYPASVFDGRVSRYPFPDHHAPPLAIMPLVAREMNAWLGGSSDRVAVLHCKAGKGRSGTMACTYLLSLDNAPTPPKLQRSLNAKERASRRAEEVMDALPDDEALNNTETDDSTGASSPQPLISDPAAIIGNDVMDSPTALTPKSTMNSGAPAAGASSIVNKTSTLKDVLELHTSRRMKVEKPEKKQKQGVSIPSQRRWLGYWALLLSHQAPENFWRNPSVVTAGPKVRLTSISLRLRESSGMKLNLIRAANAILDRTSMNKAGTVTSNSNSHVWVSLARYDDAFVDELGRWEHYTRDNSSDKPHMGKRRPGSDIMDGKNVTDFFGDDKWDKGKMVKSFARMGAIDDLSVDKGQLDDGAKIDKYTLRPLTNDGWASVKEDIKAPTSTNATSTDHLAIAHADLPASEANSINDAVSPNNPVSVQGVVLEASREVRIKLYMGQVFMGWIWFIPAFHMQHPFNGNGDAKTTLHWTRKDLDFPLGVGSLIVDMDVSLEWVAPDGPAPADQNASEDTAKGMPAAVQALAAGEPGKLVDTKQAAEE